MLTGTDDGTEFPRNSQLIEVDVGSRLPLDLGPTVSPVIIESLIVPCGQTPLKWPCCEVSELSFNLLNIPNVQAHSPAQSRIPSVWAGMHPIAASRQARSHRQLEAKHLKENPDIIGFYSSQQSWG